MLGSTTLAAGAIDEASEVKVAHCVLKHPEACPICWRLSSEFWRIVDGLWHCWTCYHTSLSLTAGAVVTSTLCQSLEDTAPIVPPVRPVVLRAQCAFTRGTWQCGSKVVFDARFCWQHPNGHDRARVSTPYRGWPTTAPATVAKQQKPPKTQTLPKLSRNVLVSKYIDRWVTYFRKTDHFRLSDETCWGQPQAAHWMAEPSLRGHHRYTLKGRTVEACDHCGSTLLWWNGRAFQCDDCQQPTYPDTGTPVREWEPSFPYPSTTFAVTPSDGTYAAETALIRVPAASNWPHGRIRPKVRVTNEGKPGR